jgi:hypothetical protein
MGATNSSSQRTNYYTLNAKCDETNTPLFKKAQKVNGAWDYSQTFDTIKGNLVNLSIFEKEYEGTKSNRFRIKLNDGEDFDQIEMSHNSLTYSIINSLLALLEQDSTMIDLSIKVYKRKDNGGKFWPGAEVNYGGQKLSWKLSMGADSIVPKPAPVLVSGKPFLQNGKPVYDNSATQKFWEEQFLKLADRVNNKTAVKPNESFHKEQVNNVDADDSDLPF